MNLRGLFISRLILFVDFVVTVVPYLPMKGNRIQILGVLSCAFLLGSCVDVLSDALVLFCKVDVKVSMSFLDNLREKPFQNMNCLMFSSSDCSRCWLLQILSAQ